VELFTLIRLFLSSHAAIVADNLFLRKQLALFPRTQGEDDTLDGRHTYPAGVAVEVFRLA
jgi:hypothetical protein